MATKADKHNKLKALFESDGVDDTDFETRSATHSSTSGTISPIIKYLQDPTVPKDFIDSCGGYLKYWCSQLSVNPDVARMALDYLSAPGKFTYIARNLQVSLISW
jgi:hypothetical protein